MGGKTKGAKCCAMVNETIFSVLDGVSRAIFDTLKV